jgi:TonB family protein
MPRRKPVRTPKDLAKERKELGGWHKKLGTGEKILAVIAVLTLLAATLIVPEVREALHLPKEVVLAIPYWPTPKPPSNALSPESDDKRSPSELKFVPLPNAKPLPQRVKILASSTGIVGNWGLISSYLRRGLDANRDPVELSIVHKVEPTYPPSAVTAHVEGEVFLDIRVGLDGTIEDVRVVNGNPVLAASAVEAIRQWRYQPPKAHGKPVRVNTKAAVIFELPKQLP